MTQRRSFGEITQLPSKRYRARYRHLGRRFAAPHTFPDRRSAAIWLNGIDNAIALGTWKTPDDAPVSSLPTFAAYAEARIVARMERLRKPLTQTTADNYRKHLRLALLATFGTLELDRITPALVASWHAQRLTKRKPTQTGHAYDLLRSIFNDAVDEGLIPANPCKLKGAGKPEPKRAKVALTISQLVDYLEAVPAPHRLMFALAGFTGMRSGEVRGLTRASVNLDAGTLSVFQQVVRVNGQGLVLTKPKTKGSVRTLAIPPHLEAELARHLDAMDSRERTALLFTDSDGYPLGDGHVNRAHDAARTAVGLPTMVFHDLRGTAATLAAVSGASVAEIMRLAGHTTVNMAIHYQGAADERMKQLAERSSQAAADELAKRRAGRAKGDGMGRTQMTTLGAVGVGFHG